MPIPGGFLLTDPNVRHPFGGTPADFVISANSTTKILSGMQATLTMWTQQTGGTRITDLQDASHNPITAVVTDAYGSLPVFYGPADNTNVLWADAGGARAKLLATDIGDRLSALEGGTTGGGGGSASATAVAATIGANINPLTGMFHASTFGAVGDGSHDDAAAINAAIVAAAAGVASTGVGGEVRLDGRFYTIGSPIILQKHVMLRGAGMTATTIKLLTNANCDVIKSFAPASTSGSNADFVAIKDLSLDGNRTNQNGAGPYYGVNFTSNPLTATATGDSFFDMHHTLENVRVYRAQSDGFHFAGRSAIQVTNCFAQQCNGHGFASTFDTNFSHCESDSAGKAGFYLNNGSCRLAVCKAYLSGQVDTSMPGFYLDGNANGIGLAACEAQNNGGPGFYFNGCGRISGSALVADSNNITNAGYPGFDFNGATYCVIDGVAWQGAQGGSRVGNQDHALRLTGGADANDIRLSHSGLGATVDTIYTTGSTLLSNRVYVNGALSPPPSVFQVQSTSTAGNGASGTTVTAVLSAAPTVGNLMIAYFAGWPTASGTASVPAGWTVAATAYNTGGDMCFMAYRKVLAGDGTSYTFGYSTVSAQSRIVVVEEITGLASGTLDQVAANSSTYAAVTPTVTTTTAVTYLTTILERTGALSSPPSSSGSTSAVWTLGTHVVDQTNAGVTQAFAVTSATGTYGATFTSSGVPIIAAFK